MDPIFVYLCIFFFCNTSQNQENVCQFNMSHGRYLLFPLYWSPRHAQLSFWAFPVKNVFFFSFLGGGVGLFRSSFNKAFGCGNYGVWGGCKKCLKMEFYQVMFL